MLFKMFFGVVPFKGTNSQVVYADVLNRNIQWPKPAKDKLEDILSEPALDLINRMIQVEPTNRLGHNLESI